MFFGIRDDEAEEFVDDSGVDVFVAVFLFERERHAFYKFRERHRLVGDHRGVE